MTNKDALDAARYRWLRHGDNDEIVMRCADGSPVPVMQPDETAPCFLLRSEQLDEAIDQAMAEEPRYAITAAGRKYLEGGR